MKNIKDELISIFRSFLNKSYNYSLNCDIEQLYELSYGLGIAGIVGYTLNKCNINNSNFEKNVYKSLNKYERLNNARKEIDELINGKYEYLYLKGLTISEYYDEPYLRYSSDLDMIVRKKDYDKVVKLFMDNGYKYVYSNIQETTLSKNNGLSIDLHCLFTIDNEKFESLYEDCFNASHELDVNYNYVFNLEHCRKHMRCGIINYKNILDIYYLRKYIDNDITNRLLNELDLKKLSDSLNNYLDCILNKREYSEIEKRLEDFIFDYGVDFGKNNRVLINSYNKSKLAYLWNRVFIPFKQISEEYPILKKKKLLLPIYYVKRIIKGRKVAIKEIRSNVSSTSQEIEKMHDFISKIGVL